MGSLSDYAENKLIDHGLGTAYTPTAAVYLSLHTADPTDAGSGAEATYTSYARQAITFGAAASRRVTQSAEVVFPESTGGSNVVTHWGVWSASTSGNMLAHGSLVASKTIVSGNTPSVASTEVYVQIDAGAISNYLANKLLDLMFRNTAYTAPATYCAVTTATVSDSSTGSSITEPSGGSYARVLVNPASGASPAWTAASSGAATNANDISFPSATASWGTVVASALCDATTAGNLLFYGNDVVDQPVGSGDTMRFVAGEWDASLT